MMKITAVVPVYNEEKTVGNILRIIVSHKKIREVIVVNDGSTDNTWNIIRKFRVKAINLKENHGKGNAVRIGTRNIKSDILIFLLVPR